MMTPDAMMQLRKIKYYMDFCLRQQHNIYTCVLEHTNNQFLIFIKKKKSLCEWRNVIGYFTDKTTK